VIASLTVGRLVYSEQCGGKQTTYYTKAVLYTLYVTRNALAPENHNGGPNLPNISHKARKPKSISFNLNKYIHTGGHKIQDIKTSAGIIVRP